MTKNYLLEKIEVLEKQVEALKRYLDVHEEEYAELDYVCFYGGYGYDYERVPVKKIMLVKNPNYKMNKKLKK